MIYSLLVLLLICKIATAMRNYYKQLSNRKTYRWFFVKFNYNFFLLSASQLGSFMKREICIFYLFNFIVLTFDLFFVILIADEGVERFRFRCLKGYCFYWRSCQADEIIHNTTVRYGSDFCTILIIANSNSVFESSKSLWWW